MLVEWGSERHALEYEYRCTHTLQAPMQHRVQMGAFGPERYRPYPKRLRPRLSIGQEGASNMHVLSKAHQHLSGVPGAAIPTHAHNFDDLCAWQLRKNNLPRSDGIANCYVPR